jgi:hypothetical protein
VNRRRWLVRLDCPDRVLEAASRRAEVDALVEQQRLLQATTPTLPEPAPDAQTALVQLACLLDEPQGVALGWLQRLAGAFGRLVTSCEAAGWPPQHARQMAITMIEDLAVVTARAAGEHARLEAGADVVLHTDA